MTDASSLSGEDRALCAAVGAWLGAHGAIAAWSLALSAIAILALLGPPSHGAVLPAALFGVAVTGLAERVLSLRLRFDAALFRGLADGALPSLDALDGTLARMGLRSAPAAPRALPDRVRGALRLLRAHRTAVVLQTVLALSAAAWACTADAAADAHLPPMTVDHSTPWENA